ncbi:MAG TPA: UDP-3-O-acyl-N-acetylglucosamine deacetylase [Fibrobacteria bacterium]|nr:UDP-3-O-acyl-N-acetylglucosamine deacetylase [Fibrobacteria bacterium]
MESPIFPTLAGVGLHNGRPARLKLGLRESAGGSGEPLFRFPGMGPLSPRELGELPREALRATRLGAGDSAIGTPEHLLAALLFFSRLPLEVECDAPELPGLDGSALPYREALARLAPGAAADPAWREYRTDLAWEYHWSYGHVRVRPAERFRVRWELDRAPLRQSFLLEDAATAFREILPARTFAFHGEWRDARARGLMAGAGEDSGLLLAGSEAEYREVLGMHPGWPGGPYPLLNRPAWRMEVEPVKHKILDLLGDLALADLSLPAADIDIRNGGHRVNHLLVSKLLAAGARTAFSRRY